MFVACIPIIHPTDDIFINYEFPFSSSNIISFDDAKKYLISDLIEDATDKSVVISDPSKCIFLKTVFNF